MIPPSISPQIIAIGIVLAIGSLLTSFLIVRRILSDDELIDTDEGTLGEDVAELDDEAIGEGGSPEDSEPSTPDEEYDGVLEDVDIVDRTTAEKATEEHTGGGQIVDDIEEVHTAKIAPTHAKLDPDHNEYIRTGKNTFLRSYFITGWPESIDDGQLQELFAQSGMEVDISMTVYPIPTSEALNRLKGKVQELEADVQLLKEDGNTVEARDKRGELDDYRGMRDTIRDSGAELFDVGMYFTVVAETNDALDRESDQLEEILVSNGLSPILATKDQIATHRTVSPTMIDDVEHKQSMMSAAIGGMMPFSSATLIKDQGIPIGEHAENGSPVIYDRFEHDRGYNWLTIGNIGAGKSFSTKLHLVRRRLYDPDTIIVMLDPLEGFAGVTNALDGRHVTVGGNTGLNPMEIKQVPESVLENNPQLDPGSAKLKDLKSFFESFYQLRDETLGKQWDVLSRACRIAYERRGIDLSDPTTHNLPSPTIQDDLVPVLYEMVEDAEKHSILNKIDSAGDISSRDISEGSQSVTKEEQARAGELLLSMEAFLEGNALANLGRKSEFEFGEEEVIWLDLQQQEGRGGLGLMMNLLFSAVYERAKQSDKNIIFAIDEARYIMRDKAALQFLEQAVRHSRHYDLSIQFITQTIDEFFQHDEAKAIADQCDHKLFFHTEGLDADIADKVNMNEVGAEFARNATPGDEDTGYSEAVFGVADEGWYPIHIRAMDEEAAVVDLDPEAEIQKALPGMGDDEEIHPRVEAIRDHLIDKHTETTGEEIAPVVPETEVQTESGQDSVVDVSALDEKETTVYDVVDTEGEEYTSTSNNTSANESPSPAAATTSSAPSSENGASVSEADSVNETTSQQPSTQSGIDASEIDLGSESDGVDTEDSSDDDTSTEERT